ncbi:hypothetical protein ACQKFK_15115 [Bacillus mycoides]|uniref:hypothetical protein n=1 Tax=Bacillus TaxID=1386 RepID=UPI002E247F66|nr:hypothetical protein [Bacillus mycoides]
MFLTLKCCNCNSELKIDFVLWAKNYQENVNFRNRTISCPTCTQKLPHELLSGIGYLTDAFKTEKHNWEFTFELKASQS